MGGGGRGGGNLLQMKKIDFLGLFDIILVSIVSAETVEH